MNELENEIAIEELKGRILAQRHSQQTAKTELLRIKKRSHDLGETLVSLAAAVAESERLLAEREGVLQ